jgi:hypothetical protein
MIRLARWPTEAFAICLAVALFPVIIAVGAFVDYSRAGNYEAAIRKALNVALLSGGKEGGAAWTDVALNTFNAELSSKYGLRPKPTFVQDPSTGNYIGRVTSSWPTSALGVVNVGAIDVTATAAVVADDGDAFVLSLDHIPPTSHVWSVNRLSGDAFLTTSAGEQTALWEGAILNPGYNIRTGQDGRVLLVRGQETILVASNSVIGIPAHAANGMSTTINQWAGSIVLAVEKRNHPHFEVDTPYLSAVVRGTRFRVTVNNSEASVKVLRGQVEVTDFKSGQHALVLPGQIAEAAAQGSVGLSLSGSGDLNTVRRGSPRMPSLRPIDLSSQRLSAENDRRGGSEGATSPGAEYDRAPASYGNAPIYKDPRNSNPDAFGWFFGSPLDQSTNAIFYIVFAGILGVILGASANWLRHRRKQKST